MQEIAPQVYVETRFEPVTVGAIHAGDGWVCIDAPTYPEQATTWREALAAIDEGPICTLILTDTHRDRCLTAATFNATIVVQRAGAAALLAREADFTTLAANELSRTSDELAEISDLKLAQPNLDFQPNLTLFAGETEIEAIERAGPLPSSAWVRLPQQRVLFAGDTVLGTRHPHLAGPTSKAWLETLNQIRRDIQAGWTVVAGRNGLVEVEDTQALSEYLRVARRRVSSLLRAQGDPAAMDETIAELLAQFPYSPSATVMVEQRIRDSLEMIYNELKAAEEAPAEQE
jgi:glyoxylase-like metal-dependent hydrolase (beta-lactamase superfamily II)